MTPQQAATAPTDQLRDWCAEDDGWTRVVGVPGFLKEDGDLHLKWKLRHHEQWDHPHPPTLAAMTKERDAQAEAVRVLAEEVEFSRVCVEPDPIYGWDEPRHLADNYQDWRGLGEAREKTDANPIARAAVEGA